MDISKEDRELIRKFDEIRKNGFYVSSSQLQAVYNRVFKVNMSATTCGSCLRDRIKKLVNALNAIETQERETQAKKETEITVEGKEVKDATIEATPKKKSSGKTGRKKRTK